MSRFTTETLHLDKLVILPDRQRPLSKVKVNDIVNNFDINALQQGTVSRRDDGTQVLLDAQHRRAAILIRIERGMEPTPREMEFRVFHGLTDPEEASLFLLLNNTNKPKWMDKFLVRITSGDGHALEVMKIITRHGWELDRQHGEGKVAAIAACERLYRHSLTIQADPNLLDVALETVTMAWGYKGHASRGSLIEGIGELIGEYAEDINLDRLVKVLAAYKGGPQGLAISAKSNASLRNVTPPMAVADLIVVNYNNKPGGAKLAPWTRRR